MSFTFIGIQLYLATVIYALEPSNMLEVWNNAHPREEFLADLIVDLVLRFEFDLFDCQNFEKNLLEVSS